MFTIPSEAHSVGGAVIVKYYQLWASLATGKAPCFKLGVWNPLLLSSDSLSHESDMLQLCECIVQMLMIFILDHQPRQKWTNTGGQEKHSENKHSAPKQYNKKNIKFEIDPFHLQKYQHYH